MNRMYDPLYSENLGLCGYRCRVMLDTHTHTMYKGGHEHERCHANSEGPKHTGRTAKLPGLWQRFGVVQEKDQDTVVPEVWKGMASKVTEPGYIVYLKLALTGQYDVYTAPKQPVTLGMAESLAEHLRRNKTDSMVVNARTGEIVQEVLA